MARSRLWKFAAVLAVGASGCALCDKCNEPPIPCTGPGCSAALNIAPAPFVAAPGSGPFSTAAAAPTTGSAAAAPTFTAPPLPDVPADSPPSGPIAPEKPGNK